MMSNETKTTVKWKITENESLSIDEIVNEILNYGRNSERERGEYIIALIAIYRDFPNYRTDVIKAFLYSHDLTVEEYNSKIIKGIEKK